MRQQPNPLDRDDPVTERAVPMDTRPAEPKVGAGRAINAAFSRNRPPRAEGNGQESRIQGAGYPSEDRDDVDPEEADEDLDEDDIEEEDEDGYQVGEREAGLETGDGQLSELMPEKGEIPLEENREAAEEGWRTEHAQGMETGDGQLEELIAPPGGDDLGGDRDRDPNLNGGHGISMIAPEEGPIPIEDEPTDTSIIGHGHEEKAAWNRDRIAHLQELEDDESEARPGTSEALGLGGAALAGTLAGWEGGEVTPGLDDGDEYDGELNEEEEVLGDLRLDDVPDILNDESINDPNNSPFLPEHRDLPDDNISIEERLIATDGEDSISAGAELGVVEELEMEDLNETDNISQRFEDDRQRMDDAAEGNERRGGFEDD